MSENLSPGCLSFSWNQTCDVGLREAFQDRKRAWKDGAQGQENGKEIFLRTTTTYFLFILVFYFLNEDEMARGSLSLFVVWRHELCVDGWGELKSSEVSLSRRDLLLATAESVLMTPFDIDCGFTMSRTCSPSRGRMALWLPVMWRRFSFMRKESSQRRGGRT